MDDASCKIRLANIALKIMKIEIYREKSGKILKM